MMSQADEPPPSVLQRMWQLTVPTDYDEARVFICAVLSMPTIILGSMGIVELLVGYPFSLFPTGDYLHGSIMYLLVLPALLLSVVLVMLFHRAEWVKHAPLLVIIFGTLIIFAIHLQVESTQPGSLSFYILPVVAAAYCWRWITMTLVTSMNITLNGIAMAIVDASVHAAIDWMFVSVVMVVIAVALSAARVRQERLRAELEVSADYDTLTGAASRQLWEKKFADATRDPAPRDHALVVLDIDHFKNINDQFGHAAGDHALCGLVDRIRQTMAEDALIVRLGGDEFVVFLEDCSVPAARVRAEDLLTELRRNPLRVGGLGSKEMSISAGIAGYPQHGKTAEQLYFAGDAALYEAKRQGRGRVAESGMLEGAAV